MNRRRFLKAAISVAGAALVPIPTPTVQASGPLTQDQVRRVLDRRLRSGLRLERFRVVDAELQEVFNLAKAGDAYDFGRQGVLEKLKTEGRVDSLEKVRAMSRELYDLWHSRTAEEKSRMFSTPQQ